MDTDLVIPEEVTKTVKSLESLDLPTDFLAIAENAFFDCSNLEEVIFSKVLPNIGPSAFYNTKVVINKN
jgi:hypothetical protein